MKSAIFASALALASADFDAFKDKYNKVYNGDEEEAHRAIYEANMAFYAETNEQQLPYELGENQFTDLSPEEYRVQAGLGWIEPPAPPPVLGEHLHQGEELAASVDWRTKGAVTPIKDQGQCGSCWAFGTVGGIEGSWQISTGSLKSLSEQQLLDCSTQNLGCQGGNAGWAINYEKTVGIASEASYPYKAVQESCKTSGFTTSIPQGGVTGFTRVGGLFRGASPNDMKSALQKQPVSIAIEADQRSFQGYKSGVLTSGCGTSLDHAVLAVGYGTEGGHDYWLVKNSWGTSWGMSGYIKIGQNGNQCGVLNQALYPQVSGSVAV